MSKRKGKSIFGAVAKELLINFPKAGVQQILGTTPKRKKKSSSNKPPINIYKEIHQHRHFHDYKAFQKALNQKK